ncbi:cuticle protein-like [Calliphora vicina]|uniref:cuticle protein-like n=1 Tax=Calliphora vicina TaxID=7373 RepID=UPI00325A7EB8
MAFKFVAVFALLAVANAGFLPAAQVYHAGPAAVVKTVAPVAHYAAQPVLAKADNEYDPHPQYKYGYNVQDNISGDSKSQVEERDGDVVRGEYSLIDADGYRRTVQYTADPINGFNAVVNREPLVKAVVAPTIVKTVAPVAHYAAAPVAHYAAAPVAHYAAAPAVVKTVAPVAHYAAPSYTTYSAPAHYVAHHFITFFAACLAVASAGVIPAAAPLAAVAQVEEYDPHPQYSYGYDVKDAITGDSKTAVETRDGGFVQGQYSLNDADGYRRIVDYTSDPINGFNAVVRREPLVAAVAAAPVVKAAPVVAAPAAVPFTYAATPVVQHAAPLVASPAVVKTTFASPLISYAY